MTTTATDIPLDPSSPVILPDSNTGGSTTLNVIAIVAPLVLGTGILIWGFLLFMGVMQRSHPSSGSAGSHASDREKAASLHEPELVEVELLCASYNKHCGENSHPLSVELLKQGDTSTSPGRQSSRKLRKASKSRKLQKKERPGASPLQTVATARPAQVTVLIAMPTADPSRHAHWEHCDIGTRNVLYKADIDDEPKIERVKTQVEELSYDVGHRDIYYNGAASYYMF
ncbi:hypothetical protein BDY19DRAFT_773537 [Irpex rosettiformis]|uniref:Uncharacterized protein n=1 Tax=Irpex rosettiformis TaxID=378272 RepID=A0ACB8U7W0_9APHY|nr:hypothetical protein BDY19DRAFT_773537 [Irpex rosettiformis]